jgi:hypothetical protein
MNACKIGNKSKVVEMLTWNKYLVYDFDHVYLTGLHWAAKRGFKPIVEVLIAKGSNLESKDLVNHI